MPRPELKIVHLGSDGAAEAREVWQWAANAQPLNPDDYRTPRERETFFVGRINGKAVCCLSSTEYSCYVRGALVKAAGIAIVGVLPAYRKQGYGAELMQSTLKQLTKSGHDVAILYGFWEEYYRRFGFESVGWRWLIKCPTHRLPNIQSTLPIRQVMPDQVELLETVYDAMAKRYSGSFKRTAADWKNRLGKNPCMIHVAGEKAIEAYAWHSVTGFWETVHVGEFAWSSRAGYEAMLAHFRGLGVNQHAVEWSEPPESPFLMRHMNPSISFELSRPSMACWLRPLESLQALAATDVTEGQAVIQVDDQRIALKVTSGTLQVTPTSQAANVSGPRHAWVQAWFGQPSLKSLIDQGSLSSDGQTDSWLCELLPPHPSVCMDFF